MHLFFLLFFIILTGCNRPDPSPELRDPIYRDLQNEVRQAAKSVDMFEKDLEDAKNQIDTAKPQTGENKTRWKAYYATEKRLDRAKQALRFAELRLDSRKMEARQSYKKAFSSKASWPDADEYEAYMRNKRLQNAPRDWNERLKQQLQSKQKSQ